MSHSVVTIVSDPRPVQTGSETKAPAAYEAMLDTLALARVEELLGAAYALFALGMGQEVRVEPSSDRVKVAVDVVAPEPPRLHPPPGRWRD